MRLWGLKLVNFIGIYNGCGREQITIDFSKCKNNILVIKGDNGSGKSTLFKALNPFSDPTSALVPNKNGAKIISYLMNDGSIVHIEYLYKISTSGLRTSTCHIKKEIPGAGITEMNPNGNVKDAKEIICQLMDIDSGIMTLAQLSSDDRGLADKTPSERKKYINSKISELDAFNEIYKKISKKSSSLKSMLNSLTTKLDAIGDTRVIQTNIGHLENQYQNMDKDKIDLNIKLKEAKDRLETIKSDISDALLAREELGNLRTTLRNYESKIGKDIEYSDAGLIRLKSAIDLKEKEKESVTKDIESLNTRRSKINESIMNKRVQIDSLSDDDTIETLKNQLETLKTNKELVDTRFKSLGFTKYEDVSVDEYNYAIETIDELQNLSQTLLNRYDDNVVFDRMALIVTNQASSTEYNLESLDFLKNRIKEIEDKLSEHYRLEKIAESYDKIPKDCNNLNSCFFIKDIVEAKSKLLDAKEVLQLEETLQRMRQNAVEYKHKMDIQAKAVEDSSVAVSFLSLIKSSINIITKFPIKLKYENDYDLLNNLFYSKSVGLEIDLRPYQEYQNLFIDSKSYQKDIDELEKQLMSISNSSTLIVQLRNDIESLEKEYNQISSEIQENKDKLNAISDVITANSVNITRYEENLALYGEYKSLKNKESELSELVSKNQDKYQESISLETKLTELNNRLSRLVNIEMGDIQSQIQKLKFALAQFDEYSIEYANYAEEFNKVEVIKKYCSPTTGIQTLFMEMYMNKVIGISNSLLSMLFGGEFVLQPFVVNEKEFKMPVLGSGILNDDISSMSTSQICMISMILSFALLHESSSIYNIIKIDELEGGLDTQNRLAFFGVLQNLMQVLMIDQCIMISHNAELNMGFMDVIVLRNTDPTSNYKEGNVIFEL